MKSVAVFCGSNKGNKTIYEEQAYRLGQRLAEKDLGLVYGGACIGLMGAVADGALSKNGKVTGVLPVFLQEKEITHKNLTELILVDTMHERKMKMNELSDGVIALPGGFGTLEEFFEMITWAQLGLHQKPVGLLNVAGFYTPLDKMLQNMTQCGFLKQVNRDLIMMSGNMDRLISQMKNYKPLPVSKWISGEQT